MKKFALLLLILAIIFLWFMFRDDVQKFSVEVIDFETCASVGNPVLESYPRQCITADGNRYVEIIGNELEKVDFIRLDSPRPRAIVDSPLEISGEAVAEWFDRGRFDVEILDSEGRVLGEDELSAVGNIAEEEFANFEGSVAFSDATGSEGTLVLYRMDEDGEREEGDGLLVPVLFR